MLNNLKKIFLFILLLTLGVNSVICGEEPLRASYIDFSLSEPEDNYFNIKPNIYLGASSGLRMALQEVLSPEPQGIQNPLGYDLGYTAALGGGVEFSEDWGLNLEVIYNSLPFDHLNRAGSEGARLTTIGPMLNIQYKINHFSDTITPVISAGIGKLWQSVNNFSNLNNKYRATGGVTPSGFAYQGKVGLEYAFSEALSLNIAYEFIQMLPPSNGFTLEINNTRWEYYTEASNKFSKSMGDIVQELNSQSPSSNWQRVDVTLEKVERLSEDLNSDIKEWKESIHSYVAAFNEYNNNSLFGLHNKDDLLKILEGAVKDDLNNNYFSHDLLDKSRLLYDRMSRLEDKNEFFIKQISEGKFNPTTNYVIKEAYEAWRTFKNDSDGLLNYISKMQAAALGNSNSPVNLKLPFRGHGPRITLIYKFKM